jgi:hypothetical protein
MAARTYSERFLLMSIEKLWVTYTVPPGKRAVVKTISMVNGLDIEALCMAYVAGILVVQRFLPAHSTFFNVGAHLVAYAGEDIGGYLGEVGGGLIVSGFLFDDLGGASTGPPAMQAPGAPPSSEPAPAAAG